MAKKNGRLLPSREKRLLEVGFSFDPNFDKFYRGLGKFLAFMRKTGLNDVPKKLSTQYKREDAWHRQQQKFYAKSPCDPNNPKSYPKYRYDELLKNRIPIETIFRIDLWPEFQEDIIEFYKTHEKLVTLPAQNDKNKKIAEIGQKVNDYMVRWKRNKLSPEQVNFLSEYIDLNFEQNKHKRNLELQIKEYLDFRKKFPDENPPSRERKRKEVKRVLNWKATIRNRYGGDNSAENKWRIEMLNEINFTWQSNSGKESSTAKQIAIWNQ